MLSKSQQTILDLILGEVAGTTRGNFVSGRFLRGKLKGILPPDLLARDLAELQPAYISSWGTGRQDNYAPPFDGLLASSHADHAKAALLTILRTWIAKRVDDVEFRMFSWPEVKQAMPPGADQDQARDATELLFFDFVAKLSKLGPIGTVDRGVWHWYTPENIETLMTPAGETGSLDDFIATIRTELARKEPIAEPAPFLDKDRPAMPPSGPEEENVTLEEALRRVLKALIDFNRETTASGTSRKWYTGPQLASATGLDASAINDAIGWLAPRDMVKSLGGAGTAPFHFMQVQLRPDGRAFYESREKSAIETEMLKKESHVDPRNVFVIHGRNKQARSAMFNFLRALKLNPIEWSEARRMAGSASPYIGQVLAAAFANARGVVAVFTGDDEAHLRPHLREPGEQEEQLTPQPRQNVLFEAGMAFGSHPDQVVLVEVGQLRVISDLTGRHAVRVNSDGHWRHDIADRLETAGCSVDKGGRDWLEAGAELEKLAAAASDPTLSAPKRARPEYSTPEMQRLFGAHVEEVVQAASGTVTIDLHQEHRSDKAWSELSIEQMKEEIHRIADPTDDYTIKSEVGGIIMMRFHRRVRV